MKIKKWIIGLALLLGFIMLVVSSYNYIYQGPRNIAKEEIAHQLNASELGKAMDNIALDYVDKVIQTNGKITAIEPSIIVIENKVQVSFQNKVEGLVNGSTVTIKGRCVGYDDLLEVVKIDQAIIINND
ncbi:MAG: hypothetical protein ABJN84_09915 [Flavobacteriaceae bacterium]